MTQFHVHCDGLFGLTVLFLLATGSRSWSRIRTSTGCDVAHFALGLVDGVFVGGCRLSLLHCAISAAAAQYGLFIVAYFATRGFAVNIAFLNILISASCV
jgi:hypothetical protein